MIRAIIFDYGNVISSVDNDRFLEEIAKSSGKTGAELNTIIDANANLLRGFETGTISPDTFFYGFVKSVGLDMGKNEFIQLFTGRFTPVVETHNLIRSLKPGYKLALLSNTNEWDFEYEIRKSPVFPLFDTVTASFQVGAMKPDKKIYLDALDKLNAMPEECVYIDDIKEYIDAACDLGIRGIHYTSHEELIGGLRKLGCRI